MNEKGAQVVDNAADHVTACSPGCGAAVLTAHAVRQGVLHDNKHSLQKADSKPLSENTPKHSAMYAQMQLYIVVKAHCCIEDGGFTARHCLQRDPIIL